jgi:hypothetical protein
MSTPAATPERLQEQARAGDSDAPGRLPELDRNDLRMVARALIGQALRVPWKRAMVRPSRLLRDTSRLRLDRLVVPDLGKQTHDVFTHGMAASIEERHPAFSLNDPEET